MVNQYCAKMSHWIQHLAINMNTNFASAKDETVNLQLVDAMENTT